MVKYIFILSSLFLGALSAATNSGGNCSGAFLLPDNGIVTISKFDLGDGQPHPVFVDFRTGYIRILSEASGQLTAGTTLLSDSPVELKAHCTPDELHWQVSNSPSGLAKRIAIKEENVQFKSGEISLAGTLYLPPGSPPFPAVILLHGSGALTRYSFGPIPHFFASTGVAVLSYDKRGTGQSGGKFDTATFDLLADDGIAAIAYLRARKDIDSSRIGLWGSSQGGFLAAAVAAKTPGLRFLINESGMFVPVWQQELYRTKSEMEAEGYSQKEIGEAVEYLHQFFEVARTGKNWEVLQKSTAEWKRKPWFDLVAHADSLEELRRNWNDVYSHDPVQPLEKVNCPILALFGGLDKSTPVSETVSNMKRALEKANNSNFEYRIFPRADHGLLEAKTGSDREIPGLTHLVADAFEFQRSWLIKRLNLQR